MNDESQGVTANPEPQPACPCCSRPNPDRTWRVCGICQLNVHTWLTEIQMLHELISANDLRYLLPAASTGDSPIGGHREPPLPLDLAALDLLTAESVLRGMDADDMGLEDWAVDWRHWLGHASHGQATERDRGPAETLARVIRYLSANWPLMARSAADGGHPAVDEFYGDVRAIRGRAWAALRLTPFDLDPDPDAEEPPDWTISCPADLGNGLCGNRIGMHRQPKPVDGLPPSRVTINCARCGSHWDSRRLVAVAIAAGVRVDMGLAEVMDHYGCTERTIRRKVAAGVLTIHRGRYRVAHHESEATG